MERTVRIAQKNLFGSKAYTAEAQVGKWYKFEGAEGYIIYGKVTSVSEDGKTCTIEKDFELKAYRPYAETKWFDKLPFAVRENEEE